MKRASRLLLLFASTVFLVGGSCPFKSTLPLAEPERGSIDRRLEGTWLNREGEGGFSVLEIIPFNDVEYFVEKTDREGATVTRMQLRAYRVAIGEHDFLQLQPLNEERNYMIGSYGFPDENTLVIRLVHDLIVPKEVSGNPERLRRLIEENLANEALFGAEKPMEFVRFNATRRTAQ